MSGASLSALSREPGLDKVSIFGNRETGTGKRWLTSALENVYEAIVGAIALDGGYEAAQNFVAATLLCHMTADMANVPENPKSELQERLQEHHITPTYELISTDGPPHDRSFVVEVVAEGVALAKGKGRSKKEAESKAAASALSNYKRTLKLALSAARDASQLSEDATSEAGE